MSDLSLLFGGVYFVSLFLYMFFPEMMKLWVVLALSSLGASLVGFWGYKDPHILASFVAIFIISSIGALIKK